LLHGGTVSSDRTPAALFLNEQRLGLVTDLYELTMAAAYWSAGLAEKLTFCTAHGHGIAAQNSRG
jgi:hypothetical protein